MSEKKLNIIRRNVGKQRHRPTVKVGIIRRCLITFVSKTSGLLTRWALDLVFSASRKKLLILEYKGKGTFARFYFPLSLGSDDRNDQVLCVISTWFADQNVHDENATINKMGSSKAFCIDIGEP
jgi:hypothetical protein